MRQLGFSLLLAAMLVSWPVFGASLYTGDELLGHCRQASETPSHYYCFGYVVGVAEILLGREEICLSHGVSPKHLMDVVVQYLQAIPAIRHEPAQISVSLALVRAFPCE
jgi:hypothetical protein